MTGQGSTAGFLRLGLSRKGWGKKKKVRAAASYSSAAVHVGLRVTGIMFAPQMVGVDPAGSFWGGLLQMRPWFWAWLHRAVGQSSIFIISSE